MKRLKRRWIHTGCAALVLVAMPVLAQEPTTTDQAVDAEPAGQVTPEARAALERMTKFFNGLERFEVTMVGSRDEVLPFGYKLQNNESGRMIVQRPNRVLSAATAM